MIEIKTQSKQITEKIENELDDLTIALSSYVVCFGANILENPNNKKFIDSFDDTLSKYKVKFDELNQFIDRIKGQIETYKK